MFCTRPPKAYFFISGVKLSIPINAFNLELVKCVNYDAHLQGLGEVTNIERLDAQQ